MEIDITINGSEELKEKLSNPDLLGVPLRHFFEAIIPDLQESVQTYTPVDTGILRAGVQAEIDHSPVPLWGKVFDNVEYSQWVESGTEPHWTSWTNLNEWAYRHDMNVYALQRAIAKRGTRGHHMFQKGFDEIYQELPQYVDELANDIEEQFGE